MKYDRLQEMFRYITPGLYLLTLVLLIHFKEYITDKEVLETVSKFSAIIILLLPFVGFVAGYFIENCMTWVERFLYGLKISRPSRKVLHGKSKWYKLNDEYRNKILQGATVNDNDTANEYQQKAKQVVGDNDIVNRYYHQSIMARHIFGAQLFASIYWLGFADGWTWWHFAFALVLVLLLAIFWYHQTCVYMKYLFAEYGKSLS